MMSVLRGLFIFCFIFVLSGCGGGEDSSLATENTTIDTVRVGSNIASPTVSNNTNSQNSDVSDTSQSPELGYQVSADDMIVDVENDLTLNFALEVILPPKLTRVGGYLTLCEYQQETRTVQRQHCVYKGPVDINGMLFTVQVSHPETILAAEIWEFKQGYEPQAILWSYSPDTQNQQFIITE